MRWFKRRPGPEDWFRRHADAVGSGAYAQRVEATWGLIGCGASAVPFALRMLESPDADIREDGAGVIGALGRDPEVVDATIAALSVETEDQARDSLVMALGQLGDRRAIPALARLLRSEATDGDTRFTAAESLGRLVRRRFEREDDPVAAALIWLDEHAE